MKICSSILCNARINTKTIYGKEFLLWLNDDLILKQHKAFYCVAQKHSTESASYQQNVN